MRQVWGWIKANPVLDVCVVVILLSGVAFYYPIHTHGAALRQKLEQRKGKRQEIENARTATVQIPQAKTDTGRKASVEVTLHDKNIKAVKKIYAAVERESERLLRTLTQSNLRLAAGVQAPPADSGKRLRPNVMVRGLFPEPVADNKPYVAMKAYKQAFEQLHSSLDAGMPPDQSEFEARRKQAGKTFQSELLESSGSLTESQKKMKAKRQRQAVVALKRDRAEELHVYAKPTSFEGGWQPGVFRVQQWADTSKRPSKRALWEGQMQLWMQQQLIRPILQLNKMDDPEKSLLSAPVKRIRRVSVKYGYVKPSGGGQSGRSSGGGGRSAAGGGQGGGSAFTLSPTGRVSNKLYDVKHGGIELVVVSDRIPEVLGAYNSLPFMSVINLSFQDVDEAKALRKGFYYGNEDVARLRLQMETLWLREWAAGDPAEGEAVATVSGSHKKGATAVKVQSPATKPTTYPAGALLTFGTSQDRRYVIYRVREAVEIRRGKSARVAIAPRAGGSGLQTSLDGGERAMNPGLMPDPVRSDLGLTPRDPQFSPSEEGKPLVASAAFETGFSQAETRSRGRSDRSGRSRGGARGRRRRTGPRRGGPAGPPRGSGSGATGPPRGSGSGATGPPRGSGSGATGPPSGGGRRR